MPGEEGKRSKTAKRQRIRKTVLLISLLLFPVTIFYFSPVLIIQGATEGIIAGSFIVFGLMFLVSLFLGRAWCGWVCPSGGLQEYCSLIRDRRARGGRYDWIKFFIWIPWLGAIAVAFITAGGFISINPIYRIDKGISLADPKSLFPFIVFVVIMIVLVLAAGRRGFCHYACWMSPFMIVGRKISNSARLPALRLSANKDECIDCKRCTKVCPMSLDVNEMVKGDCMEDPECILCGACVDSCPKNVIEYIFGRG